MEASFTAVQDVRKRPRPAVMQVSRRRVAWPPCRKKKLRVGRSEGPEYRRRVTGGAWTGHQRVALFVCFPPASCAPRCFSTGHWTTLASSIGEEGCGRTQNCQSACSRTFARTRVRDGQALQFLEVPGPLGPKLRGTLGRNAAVGSGDIAATDWLGGELSKLSAQI